LLTRTAEILVVDDNRLICADVGATFHDTALNVKAVHDASSAGKYLTENRESIAAIILDWTLPGKSGLEFLREVKDQAAFRFIPIIMMTGRSNPEDVKAGIDAGALYYITKPFQSQALRTLV